MKIIIIGSVASGKSTFANNLSESLSLPVIHLDEVMDIIGRSNKQAISDFIEVEINKDNWIIDGNAFTKVKNKRIETCDIVFVFNKNPFKSIYRHVLRYLKKESAIGCIRYKLHIYYDIRYIFFIFPKLKREAITLAKSMGKKIITFDNLSDANEFLRSNIVNDYKI
jgi:adenylate kinase family enzyme